jgi:hypothetical protein
MKRREKTASGKVLEKQCQCKGTHSGPRFYIRIEPGDIKWDRKYDNFTWRGTAGFADVVCDVCQTPWREVKDEK